MKAAAFVLVSVSRTAWAGSDHAFEQGEAVGRVVGIVLAAIVAIWYFARRRRR
jgi:hypothetical protein